MWLSSGDLPAICCAILLSSHADVGGCRSTSSAYHAPAGAGDEVDRQLELGRQIAGLLDLEDTRGVDGLAKTVSTSRPVLDPLLHEGDRGQLMLAASVMIRSR